MVSQNDNNGHSVSVTLSDGTHYTRPDNLTPNGTASLKTQASYTTRGYLLPSVAGPGQTLNTGSNPGAAAYASYDGYGRVDYTLAPAQSATTTGGRSTYPCGYDSSGWTVTATTANSGGGNHWTTATLDGLARTASVQSGHDSTTVSEVDTTYAPCACGPLGKVAWQSQPYAPPNASPPGTTYTYDALASVPVSRQCVRQPANGAGTGSRGQSGSRRQPTR